MTADSRAQLQSRTNGAPAERAQPREFLLWRRRRQNDHGLARATAKPYQRVSGGAPMTTAASLWPRRRDYSRGGAVMTVAASTMTPAARLRRPRRPRWAAPRSRRPRP